MLTTKERMCCVKPKETKTDMRLKDLISFREFSTKLELLKTASLRKNKKKFKAMQYNMHFYFILYLHVCYSILHATVSCVKCK